MGDISQKRFELLVHMGAGSCRELDQHLAIAERVVLVEPNFDVVNQLKERLRGQSRIEILETAVGFDVAARQFAIRNISDLSGLFEPTALKRFFPGLCDTESTKVDTRDAASLLAGLVDDVDGAVAVIVDVNGTELEVLQSLESGGGLSRLSALTVYCGLDPLFEGALRVDRVVRILERFGNVGVEGLGHMRRVHLEVTGLDRNVVSPVNQSTFSEPERLLTAGNDLSRALESRSQKAKDTLHGNIAELQNQLDMARAELVHARLENEAKTKHETEVLSEQNKRLRNESEKLRTSLDEKRAEVAASEQNIEALQRVNEELTGRCDDLTEANRVLTENELPQLRSDLAVALRSQAMADADLRALRARYAEVLEAKRDREELLSLLSNRLSQASAYLANETEERTEDLVFGGDVDAVSKVTEGQPRPLSPRRKKKP